MSATPAPDADPEALGPDGIPLRDYTRRWWTLAVLNLSLVLVVMGNSSVNVALPTFERELGATFTQLQWIVDGYALAFGGLLLTMGALGDRFGRRGALQTGLVIFGVAAAWAGLFATEAWHLIAARAVMGIGAALVMPATLSILTRVFPREERGKAIGIWAAFAGIGGVIGLLSSGALLEAFAWYAIFWLSVIVVVIALVAGYFLVPTSRDTKQAPLDIVGSVLSILALGGLLWAIIEGPIKGWTSPEILGVGIGALVTLALFVLWERRTTHPMLPMSFFKERGFNSGVIVVTLVFFAMFAMFFLLTQYLQGVLGHDPFAAALRFIPLTIGMIIAAPNSDRLVKRLGARPVVGGGLLLAALGLASFALLDFDTPFWQIGLAELTLGLGMGLSMAPATTIIMSSIPSDKAGVGSSMNDTAREVGGAFGVAILGSILNEVYQNHLRSNLPAGLPDAARDQILTGLGGAFNEAATLGPAGGPVILAARQAFVDALAPTFITAAIMVAVAAAIVTVFFPRDRAMVLGGHAPAPRAAAGAPATPTPVSPLAFALSDGWLVAHRGNPSTPVWRHDARGVTLVPAGGPAETRDAIYLTIHNNAGYHAVALRRKDGTEMWRRALPSEPIATPRVHGGSIAWQLQNGDPSGVQRITFDLVDGRLRGRVHLSPGLSKSP